MTARPKFVVTFMAERGINDIRALRHVLKFALRECGLRAVDAYPLFDCMSPNLPAQLAQYDTDHNLLNNMRAAARRCLRSKLSLSAHELNFLHDMTHLAAAPTPRQRDWLRDLYARAKRVGARTNGEGVRA
jgi:hypothetical protein